VSGLLQKAVGQGLITLSEFTERTDLALAARTRGELNSVLVDLPGIVRTEIAVVDEPMVLKTRTGTVKQTGYWVVPSSITAECTMGNITVDFIQAECSHREVTLRATCGSGSIVIIVPRGWLVRMEAVTSGMGNVVNKATDRQGPTCRHCASTVKSAWGPSSSNTPAEAAASRPARRR
jgi:hypothetical protein